MKTPAPEKHPDPARDRGSTFPGTEASISAALDVIATGACRRVGEHIGARAPIRIDCRHDADGHYRIFDVNMKPT